MFRKKLNNTTVKNGIGAVDTQGILDSFENRGSKSRNVGLKCTVSDPLVGATIL